MDGRIGIDLLEEARRMILGVTRLTLAGVVRENHESTLRGLAQ